MCLPLGKGGVGRCGRSSADKAERITLIINGINGPEAVCLVIPTQVVGVESYSIFIVIYALRENVRAVGNHL
jgi:hypothetical protein